MNNPNSANLSFGDLNPGQKLAVIRLKQLLIQSRNATDNTQDMRILFLTGAPGMYRVIRVIIKSTYSCSQLWVDRHLKKKKNTC